MLCQVLRVSLLLATFVAASSAATAAELKAERLFDPLHLVDVKIEIGADDWRELCSQSRQFAEALTKEPAKSPFKYYKGVVTIDGERITDVGIRKKGFLGSLDDVRPSLKIKFSEYKEQSPVEGLDRLTLNNNKQDRSLCSQFLSYKLFNESGTAASRCNFAKVTVNGQYLGVYSHVESVKPSFLARSFGDGSGDLFEGTVADLFVDMMGKLEAKSKKAKRKHVRKLAAVVANDALDRAELERLLDVDAFLKFWATESLIGFWDGYTQNQNNYFLYRNPTNSKFYFIPWGADSAFTSRMPLPPFVIKTKSVHSQSVLAYRLYSDPQFQKQYHQTLLELLDKHWNEAKLLAEIDRIEAMLKDEVHSSQKDFAASLKRLRGFVNARRKILEREIDEWPAELAVGPRRPAYFKEIGAAKATFDTTWRDKSPAEPWSVGDAQIQLTLQGKSVTFKELGVSAEPSKWPAPGGRDRKPPTIVFTGKREADGKVLILAMGLSRDQFRATTDKPVVAQGMFIEGALGFLSFLNPKSMKWISGDVHLDQAAMKDGAPVRGKVDLKIMRMSGGEPKAMESPN